MNTLMSIMTGNSSIIGLTCRPSFAPLSRMRATNPTIAAIITTGIRMRTSGTGCGRAASGTASAVMLPCGNGGAGSRDDMATGSTARSESRPTIAWLMYFSPRKSPNYPRKCPPPLFAPMR